MRIDNETRGAQPFGTHISQLIVWGARGLGPAFQSGHFRLACVHLPIALLQCAAQATNDSNAFGLFALQTMQRFGGLIALLQF
jgi:hypothetical protein